MDQVGIVVSAVGVDWRHPPDFAIHRPRGLGHWVLVHFCTPVRTALDRAPAAAGAGWCALWPAQAAHGYTGCGRGAFRNDWMHLDGPDLPAACAAAGVPVGHAFRIARPATISAAISAIAAEHARREAQWPLMGSLLTRQLIILLGREHARSDRPARGAGDDALRDLRQRILAAPEARWSLAGMAGACGLSRSRLHQRFRTAFAISPGEFVIACRVDRARVLLRDHAAASIAEIASTCGFASGQHLARHFRRRIGMAPAAWRQGAGGRSS